jgi:LCP family protein required for cell wall assembly
MPRRPPPRGREPPRRAPPRRYRTPPRRLAARCAFLSFLLPGAGQIYAGERRRGVAMLLVSGAALVFLLLQVRSMGSRGGIAAKAVDTRFLLALLAVDIVLLVFRVVSILDAFRLGRAPQAAAATLGLLTLFAIAPHAAVGYYAYRSYDTIEAVFAEEEPTDVLEPVEIASAGPDGPVTLLPVLASSSGSVRILNANEALPEEAGPAWKQRGRLNVLLVGADAGPGRGEMRTDTMIVATISTESRQTALFSVPRNLTQVPLPGGRDVFADPLNGLYEWAAAHPQRFAGGKDPGPTALKQTIGQLVGLPIDYYVQVDFRGFFGLVAALGGVDIDVPEPVLDRVSPYEEGGDWVRIDLKPGKQHLDADQAFAYVRARSQSSDYSRIARQRCVIASLAAKATPAKVLGSFRDLASTLKENVRTDIPAKTLPRVAELAAGVQLDRVTSIGFVPPQFERARDPRGFSIPDVVKIRAAVAAVIAGGTTAGSATAASGSACV